MASEQSEPIVELKRTVNHRDVDTVADFLVSKFQNSEGFNPAVRGWYCKLAYEFGPRQLYDWERRCSDAFNPAKMFSIVARDALRAFETKGRRNG